MHQTSQQLLTSCSSKLPEDQKSSSVYLHLKRRFALTSSKRSQSCHRLLVPPSGFTKLLLGLSQVQRKGMGPTFLRKWSRFFFFRAKLSTKTLSRGGGGLRGGWLRSKACKFLASGPNQPRGPRRGGETSASFLNWSHWDPQGSPRRTHRKAIKIWPCGSDEELGGKRQRRKTVSGGEKQKEQKGTVGGEEPVKADQGETRETRRVGSFSESASRHGYVPAKSREDWCYQLSNQGYTSGDVLNQSTTGVSLSCQVLAA